MNTKFIKIATCAALLSIIIPLTAQAGGADGSAGVTLKSITTLSGKTFRNVEVITADAHGLLFRHTKGTAKIDFSDLSFNIREMFQTTGPVVEVAKTDDGKGSDEGQIDAAAGDDDYGYESLDILSRTRITINFPQSYGFGHGCCNPFNPATVNWHPYWGRYHYGLSYANFHCRQAAEQDFLIRSGIARHRFGR